MNRRLKGGRLLFSFAGFAASVACILALSGTSFIRLLEWRSVDLRFSIRGSLPPDPEILLIGIDENTFRHLQLKYPFPPLIYARLIEKLSQAGASVIAVDLLYSEPTRECDPPDQDRLLADVIRKSGRVIWGMELENGRRPVPPVQPIRDALAGVGFLNLPDELDGRIRRVQPQKDGRPALAAAVLKEYAGFVPAGWRNDDLHLINYRGPSGTFPMVSMADILQEHVPSGQIANRVCLAGAAFTASHDVYATPFHDVSQPDTYGVEIHANILGNMLRGDSLTVITARRHWAVLLLLAAAVSLLLYLGRPWAAAAWWLGASAAWGAWALYLFVNHQVLFLVVPLLTLASTFWSTAFLNYLSERKRRAEIRDAFGRYVSEEVRDEVLSGRIPLDGEMKEVTVLFSDLRGFTPMTEANDPKLVVKVMNGYFQEMTEAIRAEHGLVLQIVGDEIYAVFGAPVERADHAVSAVRAALEMRRRLASLNERYAARSWPTLRHGIGIHTGRALAANIGSTDRLSYLLVGDTVNLASRLQSLTKDLGATMIISAETYGRLSAAERRIATFDALPAQRIKGKNEIVEVFRIELPSWNATIAAGDSAQSPAPASQ